MPGVTPNFAIRYPCSGEQINCATTFENWAADIDSALATVDATARRARSRPRASLVTDDAGFAVPVNTITVMQCPTVVFNNGMQTGASIIGPGSPENNGVYLFSAEFSPINAVTSVVSWMAWIAVGGTTVAQRNSGDSSGSGTQASRMSVAGLGLLNQPDFVSAVFMWTGTGGPMNIYCNLTAAYVAAP